LPPDWEKDIFNKDIKQIIIKCLDYNVEKRPTAKELKDAILRIETQLGFIKRTLTKSDIN